MTKTLQHKLEKVILRYFDYKEENRKCFGLMGPVCDICRNSIHTGENYSVVTVKHRLNSKTFKVFWVCMDCLKNKRGK